MATLTWTDGGAKTKDLTLAELEDLKTALQDLTGLVEYSLTLKGDVEASGVTVSKDMTVTSEGESPATLGWREYTVENGKPYETPLLNIDSTDDATTTLTNVTVDGALPEEPTHTENPAVVEVLTGDLTLGNGATVENGGRMKQPEAEPSPIFKTYQNEGGVWMVSGILTMENGSTVRNNVGNTWGFGGVCIDSAASFVMNGGTVKENITYTGTGGVHALGGMTMSGGEIRNNVSWGARLGTGGVFTGEFTMSGGSITGNTGVSVGGVYMASAMTMTGGSITGNKAAVAEVPEDAPAAFKTEIDSTKTDLEAAALAGGVCVVPGGALSMKGNVTIKGNTKGTENKPSNVVLVELSSDPTSDAGVIKVTGALTGGEKSIGVSRVEKTAINSSSAVTVPGVVAQGAAAVGTEPVYKLTETDLKAFFSDDPGYILTLDETNNQIKLEVAPPHTHDMSVECGSGSAVEFTALTSAAELANGGNFYLAENLTVTEAIKIENGQTVNLCLNGYTITRSNSFPVLAVGSGNHSTAGTLNICNCNKSSGGVNGTASGPALQINELGTVKLYGGAVTSAGVGVTNWGDFGMHGGSITGKGAGGIVNQNQTAKTTILGGTIECTTFGVNVWNGGTLTLGGSPTITGKSGGIQVTKPATITVLEGLSGTYSVNVNPALGDGESYAFTTASAADYSEHFAAAAAGCEIRAVGNEGSWQVELYKPVPPHSHDGVTFGTPIGSIAGTKELESGSYYLDADVTGKLEVPAGAAVKLCLNGHKLDADGDGSAVTVGAGATLDIYDCNGSGGSHEITSPVDGGFVNITGGLITGGTGTGPDRLGGGAYVEGTLNLHGGTIAGNTAQSGGGVCLWYTSDNGDYIYGALNMDGGTICHNKAVEDGGYGSGGGIYAGSDATPISVTGGSISNNHADGSGGGILYGALTLRNCSITDNTAGTEWGGVYPSSCTLGGTVTITGNTAAGQDSNLVVGFTPCTLNELSTDSSRIGVRMSSETFELYEGNGHPIAFAQPAAGSTVTEAVWGTVFTSDRTGRFIQLGNNDDGKLYVARYELTLANKQVTANREADVDGYSWHSITTADVTTGNAALVTYRSLGDGGSVPVYASATKTWTGGRENRNQPYEFFTIILNAGDSVTVKSGSSFANGELGLVSDTGEVWGSMKLVAGSRPAVYTCTMTAPAGGTYTLRLQPGYGGGGTPSVTATVTTLGADAVDTDDTLSTTTPGTYVCKVSFKDDSVLVSAPVHIHGVDGGSSETVAWTAWPKSDKPTEAGNYYLAEDVNVDYGWSVNNNTNLCLNGRTMNATGAVISLSRNVTLKICDCQAEKGTVTSTEQDTFWMNPGAAIHIYGGTVTSDDGYDGICMTGTGEVVVHGGTLNGISDQSGSTTSKLTINGDAVVTKVDLEKPVGSVSIGDGFSGNVTFEVPANYAVSGEGVVAAKTGTCTGSFGLEGPGAAGFELVEDDTTVKIQAKSGPAHTHAWDAAWTHDETGHWHACTAADCTITDYSACGVPGAAYADHSYTTWAHDAASHWKECVCGATNAKTAHTFSSDSDASCDGGCGYVREVAEPTYSISGAVKGPAGFDAGGFTVQLMRGNEVIKSFGPTEDNGVYSFTDVPPGSYNVVATKTVDGKEQTVTILVTVVDASLTGQDLAVKVQALDQEKDTNSKLEVKDGVGVTTPPVVVGGLEKEAEKVSEAESTAAVVTVTMTVQAKAESDSSISADVTAIKEEAGGATLEYLDIAVKKEVIKAGESDSSEPTPITETEELLTIVIPFDFEGKFDVRVYRYHVEDGGDGSVEVIPTSPNKDGEYMETGKDSIVLHVKKFSTYAVGYKAAPGTYTVTVTNDGNGTGSANVTSAQAGAGITLSATANSGYRFKEWQVVSGDVTISGNQFTMPAENVEVKAVFEAIPSSDDSDSDRPRIHWDNCPRNARCPIHPFADASAEAWYHDGVHYCLEKGLMEGTSKTTFQPETPTSRAMIVTILWRLQGSKVVNYALQYDDVPGGAWYTEAVRWAASEGVVKGYDADTFGPDDPISREQLATMLWRYAGSPGSGETLDRFTDGGNTSSWAAAALRWAVEQGIVTGKGGGILDPTGQATRAEAAAMVQRFFTGRKSA